MRVVGPAPLTFTAAEDALIARLHFDGSAHLLESRVDIETAFAVAQLGRRLRWPCRRVRARPGGVPEAAEVHRANAASNGALREDDPRRRALRGATA